MQKHYLLISLALIAILFVGAFTFYSNAAGIMGASITPPNLDSGLVGHWTFDGADMTSNVEDSSGQGNNGKLKGFTSTTTVSGPEGQALNFNGTSNYADIPNSSSYNFNYNEDFSLSLWVQFPSTQKNTTVNANSVLEKWGNSGPYPYVIRFYNQTGGTNAGKIMVARYDGTHNPTITSTIALNDDTWHLVTFTKSGSTLSLYIDGGLNTTTTDTTTTTTTNTSDIFVGTRGNLLNYFIRGSLDDFRIYNRSLSASEVEQLYNLGIGSHQNAPTAQLQSGLVGHWTFDGADMTSNVKDSSGEGENGYLSNFTSTTTASGVLGQALAFDGVNDVVRVTSHASLDNLSAFTYTAWVKPTGTTGNFGYIVDKNNGLSDYDLFEIDLQSTHYIEGSINTTGTHASSFTNSSASNFNMNEWIFLAMTYDDNGDRKIRLYKNGKEITYSAQIAATGSKRDDSGANLQIGGRDNGTFQFKGDIDDVRVYNRVLSASEIQSLYQQSVGTHQNVSLTPLNLSSGLIGHWTFDGPDMISNVKDSSGQGNNGHLVGYTSTTTAIGVLGQAIAFNGTSQYVQMGPDELDLTGQKFVTVSAWVKQTTTYGNPLPAVRWDSGSSDPYELDIKTSGSYGSGCSFNTSGGAISVFNSTSGGAFTPNKWYFATCTFDGTTGVGKNYVNGILTNTGTAASPGTFTKTAFGNQTLIIGGSGSTHVYFPGDIDDVRVYDRVLSASEIQQLYNLGRPY